MWLYEFSNASQNITHHFAARAYCRLIFNLVTTRTPRSFSRQGALQQGDSQFNIGAEL